MELYVKEKPKNCNECILGKAIPMSGCGLVTVCSILFGANTGCPLKEYDVDDTVKYKNKVKRGYQ